MRDEVGGMPFTNVHIINNSLNSTAGNGIYVVDGQEVYISGNTVVSPNSVQYSKIFLGDVHGGSISNNSAYMYNYDNLSSFSAANNSFNHTLQSTGALIYSGHAAAPVPEANSWIILLVAFFALGGAMRQSDLCARHGLSNES